MPTNRWPSSTTSRSRAASTSCSPRLAGNIPSITRNRTMSVYVATFSAVAVTAAQDAFEIVAPSNSRVAIREISLGQYSDSGDAQAELLSVLLIRGHGTAGTGGSVLT